MDCCDWRVRKLVATMSKDDDMAFFAEKVGESKFVPAKTMPQYPHEYTLRRTWSSGEDFERCVKIIRIHGYLERFYGKPFMKLAVEGFKYWTMGEKPCDTILINRADLNEQGDWLD